MKPVNCKMRFLDLVLISNFANLGWWCFPPENLLTLHWNRQTKSTFWRYFLFVFTVYYYKQIDSKNRQKNTLATPWITASWYHEDLHLHLFIFGTWSFWAKEFRENKTGSHSAAVDALNTTNYQCQMWGPFDVAPHIPKDARARTDISVSCQDPQRPLSCCKLPPFRMDSICLTPCSSCPSTRYPTLKGP